jgi:hypothetical protein
MVQILTQKVPPPEYHHKCSEESRNGTTYITSKVPMLDTMQIALLHQPLTLIQIASIVLAKRHFVVQRLAAEDLATSFLPSNGSFVQDETLFQVFLPGWVTTATEPFTCQSTQGEYCL